jgi:hypothetical protein
VRRYSAGAPFATVSAVAKPKKPDLRRRGAEIALTVVVVALTIGAEILVSAAPESLADHPEVILPALAGAAIVVAVVTEAISRRLVAVRRDEAEAVSRLIEDVIGSTHVKLARSSRRDQWLFFLLGLLASIPVQILVTLLTR